MKYVEILLLLTGLVLNTFWSVSCSRKPFHCSRKPFVALQHSAAGLQSVYGLSWIDFVLYVLSFLCLFHFRNWTDSQNDLYWPSRARVVLNPTTSLWFTWFVFYYFISTSVFSSGTFPVQMTFTLYNWALFMELWNRRKVFQNVENEKKTKTNI